MKIKSIDLISKIMSKRQVVFTENFTIIFFLNEGKTGNVQNLSLRNFRRPSFGDDINVTFIS